MTICKLHTGFSNIPLIIRTSCVGRSLLSKLYVLGVSVNFLTTITGVIAVTVFNLSSCEISEAWVIAHTGMGGPLNLYLEMVCQWPIDEKRIDNV